MKKLASFFTAVFFLLTLGMASAEEGAPWQQREVPPLIKSKPEDAKNKDQKVKKQKKKEKKKEKKKKKQKAKKKEGNE